MDNWIEDAVHVSGEVAKELNAATNQHGPMVSAHEGFAVILEEVDELWEEVRKKHKSVPRMREEAIQIAAMAMRFVIDICGVDNERVVEPSSDSNAENVQSAGSR